MHAGILKKFRQKGESNAKTIKKICGIGLALAMCTTGINCGFVSAAQGDNVTFNGSVDTGNPTGNAVDGDMGTYFIINNTSVNSKIINIKFAESYKGMSIYSGQEGVWPEYLSASAIGRNRRFDRFA